MPADSISVRRPPRYPPHSGFYATLRREVEAEIASIAHPRDAFPAYAKIAAIAAFTIACYVAYLAVPGWAALLLAVPFGFALSAIGFNIQHDGGHEALSRFRFINRCAAYSLDLVGGSSYVWRWKHNLYHHSYPNVGGVDSDIELAPMGRLAPFQRRRWFHRYQHLYLWLLYGLLPPKWQLIDDFSDVLHGRVGQMPLPRPRGLDLFLFAAGKCWFVLAAFVVPVYVHGTAIAVTFYFVASLVLGVMLSVVFQLAHCIEETAFHPGEAADEWALHQLATTSDFAPRSRLLRWYLGGLNFQVEHHLFPHLSHVHYPRLVPVVRRVCSEAGAPYLVHETLVAAIRSHYRLLAAAGRNTLASTNPATNQPPAWSTS
jgi:linoleoyl-CoA desaturase